MAGSFVQIRNSRPTLGLCLGLIVGDAARHSRIALVRRGRGIAGGGLLLRVQFLRLGRGEGELLVGE